MLPREPEIARRVLWHGRSLALPTACVPRLKGGVFTQWIIRVVFVAALAGDTCLGADDLRPMAGPGATKAEVLDSYGRPTGQSRGGGKEILNYPQGQVILENDRVERLNFAPTGPAPAASASSSWLVSFDEALREAARRNVNVLALFTGYDWSPASRRFQDEVANQADFLNAFSRDHVLLRLDFPMRTPISSEEREQNEKLRARYGVTSYPTLLVLAASGERLREIDLTASRVDEAYRARLRAAVQELRAPAPAPAASAESVPAPAGGLPAADPAVASSLSSARQLVSSSLIIGGGIAAFFLWLMWRKGPRSPGPRRSESIAARINAAASGLPTTEEITGWRKEHLSAVTTRLAQSEGYLARMRPADPEKDVVLTRPGESKPCAFVCCAPGGAGVVAARRVRELVATLTAEGVIAGWFVAPDGFSADARIYAEQHSILLIDSRHLLGRLRELPPLVLDRVLGR